jgi:hypothetical protein
MNKRLRARLASITLAATFGLAMAAGPASAASPDTGALQMYEATVTAEQFAELQRDGFDIVAPEPSADGVAVDLVLSPEERAEVAGRGVELELFRDPQGRTVRDLARRQAAGGFEVWRDYDGPDGMRQYLTDFVAAHPKTAKLRVIGTTTQGREIVAVRITEQRRGHGHHDRISRRPAVLYQGTTHAREWISTEVTRRLMEYFAGNSNTAKSLRRTRQLWFVPVVNPDGYQYTFDGDRLWRKNLRDNDGDGQITNLDGVDINRNYPEHWRYDDEGSSSETSSQTYRGPAAASEPETQANMDLVRRIEPKLVDSYHSYGPLLLYPEGWQIQTPARDLPVYIALSGNDAEPAVEGTDPDVSAELYTTNGEFTDWAHHEEDVLAWTSELDEGCDGCGFVFPDDEDLVQHEFEINLPFAIDMARSAADPARPSSHLGNTTEPFYLELVGLDPTYANNPLADFRFQRSYGDPQPVDVLARNSLRDVRLEYRINGGAIRTAATERWQGGETFGDGYDTYYGIRRGEITGTDPGDSVEVWFSGVEAKHPWNSKKKGKRRGFKRVRSESFTYEAISESGADTLVVAAEDYTGISPDQGGSGPNHLSFYTDALSANGVAHDVYDIDASGRTAPDALGVLGHYEAVLWYTGDDVITREPGMVPGTASRLANDQMLEMRSYMNEGGKVLYTGKNAGVQYQDLYAYDPVANAPCGAGDEAVDARCQLLSSDFLQYYLGAALFNDGGGLDPETGEPFPIQGVSAPFDGLDWSLNGGDSADNQDWANSFVTTSSLLPTDQYPQFAGDAPAEWDDGVAGAFEPFDGSQYLYSNRADESYKRLTRTIDVPDGGATLSFRTSYDTEAGWDFLFVEANAGGDQWTTLPDANGHTSDDTGDSCPEGWIEEIHPFLAHYQTSDGAGTCTPTGSSGEWNAASGRSAGWEQWEIDLSEYAGSQVEVSIAYASDWGTQKVGAFLDDIQVSTGDGTTSFEDDGDPMDGWTVSGAPPGSDSNPNDWERSGSVGFEEGAVVSTDDSLFFGFGFEGVQSAAERNEVMARTLEYLRGSP